jgi:cob(I)alamin adenosyltransferase
MKKGLLQIYTGEGKGKTTSAIGLTIRAAGQGLKVLFAQFLKPEDLSSGEKSLIRERIPEIELIRSNISHPIFTMGEASIPKLKSVSMQTLREVQKRVEEGNLDLLVMDELNNVLNEGWIELKEVTDFLEARPAGLEVVITGRDAPVELIKMADYVTEMLKIKHPFDEGIKARKGIEF